MLDALLLRKATLFIPTGPVEHLHVVMNHTVFYPVARHDAVLAVNFGSIKPGVPHDATCEVARASIVSYGIRPTSTTAMPKC